MSGLWHYKTQTHHCRHCLQGNGHWSIILKADLHVSSKLTICKQTFSLSKGQFMFVSSYSTCQFITATTGPFQVCLLNESMNVITYFLLCTHTEKSHMSGDNIHSLPSDTDSVHLKDNEFSNLSNMPVLLW